MSSTQPPVGPPDPSIPPTGATPPPSTDPAGSVPPPPSYGSPPSAPSYGTPPPPAPGAYGTPYDGAAYGSGSPGNLLDRFVARLVDLIIVGIVAFVISVVLAAISDSWLLTNFVSAIVDTVLYLGYFALLESSRGQTLGKMLMKLKVSGPDGQRPPTLPEAVRRNIWLGAAILGIIPFLGSFIGGVIEIVAIVVCAVGINSDKVRRQHWFDRFAGGTQVTKIG